MVTPSDVQDRRARVLVVASDVPFARALARDLRSRASRAGIGIESDVSFDADDACACPAFDVALIDAQLRVAGHGVGLLRRLRRRRATRQRAAIVMSDAALDAIACECALLGATVLPKRPIEPVLDCALVHLRRASSAPRTPLDEVRAFTLALATEAHLSAALTDVLLRIVVLDEDHRAIGNARGTTVETVNKQAKAVRGSLAEIGVPLGRDVRASVLAALIYDRDREEQ